METTTFPVYHELDSLYGYLNLKLFDGELPMCAITLTRHKGSYGFFLNNSFGNREGARVPEIALNPDHFLTRTDAQVISTLLHEMCHYYQLLKGKPSRKTYHNAEFAAIMLERGLICSATGKPGGKKTGQKMTHYIDPDGPFQQVLEEYKETHVTDWGTLTMSDSKDGKKRAVSKVKYTCPMCEQNAWAKPGASLLCGNCSESDEPNLVPMNAELIDNDEG